MPISQTALIVAMLRGRQSALPQPLCQDPYALALAGAEGEEALSRLPHLPLDIQRGVAARTAFLDELLRRFVRGAGGPRQVLILGAGLDSRAARLAAPGVTFFEIDQPDIVAYKQRRIAAVPGYPAGAARHVTCDFAHQHPLERARAADLSPEQPTLVLMEGVASFLPVEALLTSLSAIARGLHPDSLLVFDVLVNQPAERGAAAPESPKLARMHSQAAELGEPFQSTQAAMLPLIYQAGFRYVRHATFHEVSAGLYGSYQAELDLFAHWHVYLASRAAAQVLFT